jgi:chromosome segregation ATPase
MEPTSLAYSSWTDRACEERLREVHDGLQAALNRVVRSRQRLLNQEIHFINEEDPKPSAISSLKVEKEAFHQQRKRLSSEANAIKVKETELKEVYYAECRRNKVKDSLHSDVAELNERLRNTKMTRREEEKAVKELGRLEALNRQLHPQKLQIEELASSFKHKKEQIQQLWVKINANKAQIAAHKAKDAKAELPSLRDSRDLLSGKIANLRTEEAALKTELRLRKQEHRDYMQEMAEERKKRAPKPWEKEVKLCENFIQLLERLLPIKAEGLPSHCKSKKRRKKRTKYANKLVELPMDLVAYLSSASLPVPASSEDLKTCISSLQARREVLVPQSEPPQS